jgi:hypothetical protein
MRGVRGQELLRRPVRVRGIQVGRAVDLIFDPGGQRVLGFDVLCGDGAHRFLPISVAEAGTAEISVRSSLTLLDPAELDFYRERGTTLTALREELDDVVLDDDGAVAERLPKRDGDAAVA